jgi:translation initiation factor IF-3
LGEIPTANALRQAQEGGFDLVEVNPSANPPVAKFLNYGSFKYQQEKQAKQQKKQLKKIETKGIRLSTKIGDHDLETRRKKAEEFLEDEQKVRIEIILRGRENQHQDLAREVIADFTSKITVPFEVEQPTNRLGNKIFTIILPTKKS